MPTGIWRSRRSGGVPVDEASPGGGVAEAHHELSGGDAGDGDEGTGPVAEVMEVEVGRPGAVGGAQSDARQLARGFVAYSGPMGGRRCIYPDLTQRE